MKIPADRESAIQRLTALDKAISARQWERAAIVAAYVRPAKRGRPQSGNSGNPLFNVSEFTRLGIHGLTTGESVRAYLRAWELSGEDTPEPGDDIPFIGRSFPEIGMLIDRNPVDLLRWAHENIDFDELSDEDLELILKSTAMFAERLAKHWDKLTPQQRLAIVGWLRTISSIVREHGEESDVSEEEWEAYEAHLYHEAHWPKHLENRRKVKAWGKAPRNRAAAKAWLDADNAAVHEAFHANEHNHDDAVHVHVCHCPCPELPDGVE